MSDSVADYLTRIRNAVMADYDHVIIPASRFSQELSRLLVDEGYIEGFSIEKLHAASSKRRGRSREPRDMIRVELKYTEDRRPVISGLRRISKPGRRQYVTADNLPRVLGGMGTAIVTTSRGVMTAYEAKRQHVGGELVAFVW